MLGGRLPQDGRVSEGIRQGKGDGRGGGGRACL